MQVKILFTWDLPIPGRFLCPDSVTTPSQLGRHNIWLKNILKTVYYGQFLGIWAYIVVRQPQTFNVLRNITICTCIFYFWEREREREDLYFGDFEKHFFDWPEPGVAK